MTLEPFIYCAFTALVVLGLAWQPWRAPVGAAGSGELRGTLGNALAWPLGAYVAYYALKARLPAFPPTEAEHWWALAAPLAIVPGLLGRRAWWTSTLLGGGLFAAFAWFASEPLREHFWRGAELWLQVGGAAAFGAVLFGVRPRPARRDDRRVARPAPWGDGPSYPVALALASAAGAAVLGQSYGGAAHLAGALTFFPATLAGIAMLRPGRRYWPGMASAWSLGLPGLMLTGVWFAEAPWSSALLVGLSPQLARLPLAGGRYPRAAALVHGLLVAAVGALALWLALSPEDPYAGEYGGYGG